MKMPKYGSMTLAATANLANFLPTGTILAFEALTPSFSNNGACEGTNRFLTFAMIVGCSLACFLSSFTDSYIAEDRKLYYGIATFKGLFVLSDHDGYHHEPADEDQLEKFRLTWADFVHAFGSLIIFLLFALSSNDIQHCFFPKSGTKEKKNFKNLQLGVTFLGAFVFTLFPTKRRGIGYACSDQLP